MCGSLSPNDVRSGSRAALPPWLGSVRSNLISRCAMLGRLGNVEGGPAALSFVHMFYRRPSTYLWEDAEGTVHTINLGEGGEQGDALMPVLFSFCQHSGVEATYRRLRVNEKLFACFDDVHIASEPDRTGAVYTSLEENLLVWQVRSHPFAPICVPWQSSVPCHPCAALIVDGNPQLLVQCTPRSS